jgi:hypothetical protein
MKSKMTIHSSSASYCLTITPGASRRAENFFDGAPRTLAASHGEAVAWARRVLVEPACEAGLSVIHDRAPALVGRGPAPAIGLASLRASTERTPARSPADPRAAA